MTTIQNRKFMHCQPFKEGMKNSDQSKGVKAPPFCNPIKGELFTLPSFENITKTSYMDLLDSRRSVRKYTNTPMSQEQLAFMLWSTQGIQSLRTEVATFRTVPSGGARHPFETYITVKSVEALPSGLYHYLPTENIGEKIVTIQKLKDLPDYDKQITDMTDGQSWAANASIVLFYSCVPYKTEWRYVDLSHRLALMDVGHVGQNAMLSAAALGLGSCCIAAYDQKICDDVIGLDGLDEFMLYAVTVGTAAD